MKPVLMLLFELQGLMKVILWLLHPDRKSRATLKDLSRDKWVHQPVDISQYSFESVLGGTLYTDVINTLH